MNLKDSQTQEIFSLGLNPAEFGQLRDLLNHVKHIEMEARPEEKLRFISLSTINRIAKNRNGIKRTLWYTSGPLGIG